jgi:ATP-dependent protease ClpP protease subunit
MKMLAILILTIQLVFATAVGVELMARADSVEVDTDRLIKLVGTVDRSYFDKAFELETLVNTSLEPVWLLINSGGGSVMPGIQFISAMKLASARNVTINCIVPVLAASMAFHILAHCDNRYVFEDTFLLWHPMRISGMIRMTADELEYEAAAIRMYEEPMNDTLIRKMRVKEDIFWYHYNHETMWTASALDEMAPGFLTIIDDVKNIPDLFKL